MQLFYATLFTAIKSYETKSRFPQNIKQHHLFSTNIVRNVSRAPYQNIRMILKDPMALKTEVMTAEYSA